jgi:hypothetical protein
VRGGKLFKDNHASLILSEWKLNPLPENIPKDIISEPTVHGWVMADQNDNFMKFEEKLKWFD